METLWNDKKFSPINFLLEKKALLKSDLILSPSKFLIHELKSKYSLKSYYLPQIINKLKHPRKKNKKKIILTFGSISPGKGSNSVINNIDSILKLDHSIFYYWIGNVDKKYYKSNFEFEKILKQNTDQPKRVKVLNKMNRKNLFSIINKACIVLLPSYRDNSPNACLEALSLKKIVVARKNSGYNDLINDNHNGFLFNKKNDKDIVKKISFVLNFSNKKKTIIEKKIEKKNKDFYPKMALNKYLYYLKKLN